MVLSKLTHSSGEAFHSSHLSYAVPDQVQLPADCKAAKPVIFTKRFFNNIYLIGAFLIGFALITAVMTIPALQGMFKVVTLNMSQLLTVYGLALLNLPVIQLLKWIRNKVNHK